MGPGANQAYEAERSERCQQGAVAACVLGLLLIGAFALCDQILVPERAALLLRVRLAYVVILALFALLLRGPFGRRYALGAGLVLGIVLAVMVNVLVALTGGVRSPYYAGNSLVLMGISIMLPWPPVWVLGTSVLIVGIYGATVWITPVHDPVMIAITLAFLASTVVVAVVAAVLGERLRRREFEGRVALAEALAHKSDFLASVSHDLRTPLNVVIGYAQLLAEETFGPLTADQADALGRILRTSTMQLTLINDLLDLARIEQGKIAYECRSVAVADLVPQLDDTMGALLHARPVRFETDVAADAVVWSDPDRLAQVLSNLLANAAKFTEAGKIRLTARRAGASVSILVTDSGPGMGADLRARALDPFVRGEADAPGWGLGLAIVDRLVRLLEGTIEIDSRLGVGTTVTIVLPAAPGAAPALTPPRRVAS
jgi:signal transduction histidine kinase